MKVSDIVAKILKNEEIIHVVEYPGENNNFLS